MWRFLRWRCQIGFRIWHAAFFSSPHSCVRNLSGRAEEDYEKTQPGWLVSQTGFEPGSSRIKIGIITTRSLLYLGSFIRTLIFRLCSTTSTRVPPVATVLRSFTNSLNISRYWHCHWQQRWGNAKTISLSLAKVSRGVQTPSRLWFLWQSHLAGFKIATRRASVCLLCMRRAAFW